MFTNWQKKLAIILVLTFGASLFYFGTEGFTAFTAETARMNALINQKPSFPEVTLEDSEERVYPFSEFEGQYVFITFIYTSCETVCLQLETNMSRVYNLIPDEYLGKDILFLSISFDPERDDPATLHEYRKSFDSDGETWRMARISDQEKLDSLLDEFGVIVIPDGYGDYAHNSAFYLVDKSGNLMDVMDYKKVDEAADKIINVIEDDRGN